MTLWGPNTSAKLKLILEHDYSPLLYRVLVKSQIFLAVKSGARKGRERGNKISLLRLFGRGSSELY